MAIGYANAAVHVRDLDSGELLWRFQLESPVRTLRFNAKSTLLLAAQTDGKVVVLDLANGRWRAHLGNHGENVAGIGHIDNGTRAAVVDRGSIATLFPIFQDTQSLVDDTKRVVP